MNHISWRHLASLITPLHTADEQLPLATHRGRMPRRRPRSVAGAVKAAKFLRVAARLPAPVAAVNVEDAGLPDVQDEGLQESGLVRRLKLLPPPTAPVQETREAHCLVTHAHLQALLETGNVMWLSRPIRGLMLDITGVLYESGGSAIPGSIDALNRVRAAGLPLVLVSNESTLPTAQLVDKLHGLGFTWITLGDVITPVPIMRELLLREGLNPHLLVHPDVENEFTACMKPNEPKTCVVLGDAVESFSYQNMNIAFNCLLDMPHPRLFCLGKGRCYRHQGTIMLDVGAFTVALEFAASVTAEVIGKPSSAYFQAGLKRLNLKPDEVVMVGDDLHGDVVGAVEAGCRGVLVRTGKFRAAWEQHETPDFVADNLEQVLDMILGARK